MVREGKLCLLSLLQFIYILISFPRPALESTSESKTNILKMKSRPFCFSLKTFKETRHGTLLVAHCSAGLTLSIHIEWPVLQGLQPLSADILLSSLSTPWEEVLALNTANREMLPPFPPSSFWSLQGSLIVHSPSRAAPNWPIGLGIPPPSLLPLHLSHLSLKPCAEWSLCFRLCFLRKPLGESPE